MESPRLTEYKYEGMMMLKEIFPSWALDKLKETLFDDSDIIIATYPKCGKFYYVNLFWNTDYNYLQSWKTTLFNNQIQLIDVSNNFLLIRKKSSMFRDKLTWSNMDIRRIWASLCFSILKLKLAGALVEI